MQCIYLNLNRGLKVKKIARLVLLPLLTACFSLSNTITAHAQSFPNKPVKILVGLAPGGGTDSVARLVAEALSQKWGQPVVVENRTGASGMIAAEQLVKAEPDGYTLLISPQTSIAVAPQMVAKPAYDPLKDLTPITILATSPLILVAHPSFPANTFSEYLAYVRANPDKVTFASGGNGSSPHMVSELLNTSLKLKTIHVPYRGEQPAIADVLGNQVNVLFANVPSAMPHVRAGKLKAIVQTGEKRSALAPEKQTIKESGESDIVATTWNALYAPAKMPPALVAKIYADVSEVLRNTATNERLVNSGNDVPLMPPVDFAKYLRGEVDRWGKVIKAANIRMD
jgi:tripartite-type tricarboxylate transporter receptor subunit TctC